MYSLARNSVRPLLVASSSQLKGVALSQLSQSRRRFCDRKAHPTNDSAQPTDGQRKSTVRVQIIAPENPVKKEILYDQHGNKIYEHDCDKQMSKEDWQEFEKIFKLDNPDASESTSGCVETYCTDEDGDDDDDEFKNINFTESHRSTSNYNENLNIHNVHNSAMDEHVTVHDIVNNRPQAFKKVAKMVNKIGKHTEEDNEDTSHEEDEDTEVDMSSYEKFLESFKKVPNYDSLVAQGVEEEEMDTSPETTVTRTEPTLHSKHPRKPKRQIEDDGSTRKPGRRPRANQSVAKTTLKGKEFSKRSKVINLPSLSPDDEILRVPVNTRKPGYERRIQTLQAEMERISSELLGEQGNEFDEAGAIMQYALLSPDGFNLQIFFQLDDDPSRLLQRPKAFESWKKRVANKVRATLAAQMYIKRTPKVELVQVDGEGLAEGARSPTNLDALFENIAAEREKLESQIDDQARQQVSPVTASVTNIEGSVLNSKCPTGIEGRNPLSKD